MVFFHTCEDTTYISPFTKLI